MKNKYKKYGLFLGAFFVAATILVVGFIHPKAAKTEVLELKAGLEEKVEKTDSLLADIQKIEADLKIQQAEINDLTKKIEIQKKTVKEHQSYIEKNRK